MLQKQASSPRRLELQRAALMGQEHERKGRTGLEGRAQTRADGEISDGARNCRKW